MAKENRKTKEEWAKLFLMYQSNMFPSLVRWLAEELEVTEASINGLGVGFDYLKQAWVFAERNERGQIIGLSLRFVAGGKGCIEGSQRGLTYECLAETKKRGSTRRKSGYIPCRIAGVDCPKCGAEGRKWCMVSSDDPHNPTSCICGRTPEGAVEYLKGSGYRHQLRDDPASDMESNLSPLPTSDHPTLVVEGASDVLAAMDSGFVAVGKPNNMGTKIPYLARILRDRSVVVMGEHDAGAGTDGMIHSGKRLLSAASNVKLLMPPIGYKDFRAWAPSVEVFYAECEANATDVTVKAKDKKLLADSTWDDKGEIFIASQYSRPGHCNLIEYDGKWWMYNGHCYESVTDKTINGQIQACFKEYMQEYFVMGESEWRRLNVGKLFRQELRLLLEAWRHRKRKPRQSEPFYLEGSEAGTGFNNKETIVFENGMLDVSTGRLLPMSQNIFFRDSVPYAYNALARCDRWLTIIDQIFEGDEESIALLQEWFGYNLLASSHLHAVMFMYGVSGSGKSTICTAMQNMVGEDRCVSPDIETLSGYVFGKECLLGKYVIQIDEEQNLQPSQRAKYLSFIKKTTGRDRQNVSKKYGDSVNMRTFGKITHVCDTLIGFIDESLSMKRRIHMLKFEVDFRDNPDYGLEDELITELPGIAAWAVCGLQRLLKNNKFTHPAKSAGDIASMLEDASPIRTMLKDHVEVTNNPKDFVLRLTAFQLYRSICDEQRVKSPCGMQLFRRRFCEAWPEATKHEGKEDGKRGYRGIKIKQESVLRYLGD